MICFHHNDLDGRCSAAIVKTAYPAININFIEVDYSSKIPFDLISKDESVIIVDFSFGPEGFEKLKTITEDIVWIDHHTTAIDSNPEMTTAKGVRGRGKPSACYLTWCYYFNDIPPRAVQLVSDYDTWQFRLGEDTLHFFLGIQTEDDGPTSEIWKGLLDLRTDNICTLESIRRGKIIEKYQDNRYKRLISDLSYEVMFEDHLWIVCNSPITGRRLFNSIDVSNYYGMIITSYNGKNWIVSLRSDTDKDVSKIAVKYGGGGHKNAAGFICDALPFSKKTNLILGGSIFHTKQ